MIESAWRKRGLFQHSAAIIGLYLIGSALLVRLYGAPPTTYSTWKVFYNRAGWSIDYPPDWKVASCRSCSDPATPEVYVDFFPPSEKDYGEGWVMVEHLADKPSEMSPGQWLSKIMKANNLNPVIKTQRFVLNGLPALTAVYGNRSNNAWKTETKYVLSQAQTFALSFDGKRAGGEVETLGNYPVYLKMVSSFRVRRPIR